MNIEQARKLYDENLNYRTFQITTDDGIYYIYFTDYNFNHLAGVGSSWQDRKLAVFPKLCYPNQWKMIGDYIPSMGDLLDADILVGGQNGVFGFRYDEETSIEGEDYYYACTCLDADIRNASNWTQIRDIQEVV